MRQPIKIMAHPLGHRLESHTKTLINRRFPRFSVTSAQYRGGSVGVDVFFSSFICAKRKDRSLVRFFLKRI